jgi:hypothetical protein
VFPSYGRKASPEALRVVAGHGPERAGSDRLQLNRLNLRQGFCCNSRSATVGMPSGRVPLLPGPLGISTRLTGGAR